MMMTGIQPITSIPTDWSQRAGNSIKESTGQSLKPDAGQPCGNGVCIRSDVFSRGFSTGKKEEGGCGGIVDGMEKDPGQKLAAELTKEEKEEVQNLRERDREVRSHEQAHMAAGGQYVRGGASYEYKTGPDGRNYAVGGEVAIDAGPVPDNPQATIQKAQTIKRAALAPAQPSPQDHKVAAKAGRMEAKARAELSEEKAEQAITAAEQKAREAEVDASVGREYQTPSKNPYIKGTAGASAFSPQRAERLSSINIYV